MKNTQSDLAEQVVRGAPAAAGAVASAVTLSEWVGVVTITYVILQAAYLIWKATWERQERIEARARAARQEAREERSVAAAEVREEARKQAESLAQQVCAAPPGSTRERRA